MASVKMGHVRLSMMIFLIFLCIESKAKLSENKTSENHSGEMKQSPKKMSEGGAALLFADDFKQTLEKYLFGMCPQTFKSRWLQMSLGKGKNATSLSCDIDAEQTDLAGRLATLALRAHTASRTDCSRLGAALANTLGELARTAASRQVYNAAAAAAATEAKKRKLSKSQKMKIQAKQRTALAVKKKAAAVAAAAAAKISS